MGGTSGRVATAAREAGIEKLASGVSGDEAVKLWKHYDADGNGVLDKDEAKKLLADLVNVTCDGLQKKIDNLQKTMQDPAAVDEMLSALDLDGDGNVTKSEFVAKAMFGVSLLPEPEERPAKRARTAASSS
eukprot:TRINITY_DN2258_c0_g1_i1.p1 TRINITY_DN2258_c0_g1~~TRINITY_DN2258_c0_g1_i1.p1  ORF type:complete len:131 (+),score=35.13 TRINITY_DN2258_c0_g1_i1:60-452(+)